MKKHRWGKIITTLILLMLAFCYWQNNSIVVSSHFYSNERIPSQFDGFKIVHISDLHNKKFGESQRRLLNKIEKANPDIIVITGDLIDRRRYNLEIAMEFINGAIKIAPIYYVPGNHEAWSGKYEHIRENLNMAGVNVLEDTSLNLQKGDEAISIIGVRDPDFLTSSYMQGTEVSSLEETLKEYSKEDSFKILLSHRPELINLYSKYNLNLVFTGHAHGGQFRIPFVGGLVAPDQGFFPKYTSGCAKEGDTSMYISRGLGNSIVPIRIFNRPEIVLVTLSTK